MSYSLLGAVVFTRCMHSH